MQLQKQEGRTPPNRLDELWLGLPKGGRTLGASDDVFFEQTGVLPSEKISRRDDYIFVDGKTGQARGIRGFDIKPTMALNLLSKGRLDCAIVGRDVLKEFNLAVRGQEGVMQAVEILDMGMSNCALTIAVQESDTARTAQDLNGRNVVTKYPETVANWAKMKGIQFRNIISGVNTEGDITGGIEGYPMFDPDVTVIADMVESGESLVQYGWKPLGMNNQEWAGVKKGVFNNTAKAERQRFIDLKGATPKETEGVILKSNAVLVRNAQKLTEPKEANLEAMRQAFFAASKALGFQPRLINKGVSRQRQQARQWQGAKKLRPAERMTSHAEIFGL